MREWPRILIVDDDPAAASLMGHYLAEKLRSIQATRQCSVTPALGAEMALRLMREEGPFDIVLTDGYMPGMDGIQLARAIRAGRTEGVETGTSRNVVIGMLTAWSAEEDREHALIAGCDFVISKPVWPDIVIDHMLRALDKSPDKE
jgi:two-component system cell cycle response regulator